MKAWMYKYRYFICSISIGIVLFLYMYVDWMTLFGERIVVSEGDHNYEIITKFYQNHIWAFFGKWGFLMHFTVISFVFFAVMMLVRGFNKSPLTKLLVLYSFVYCLLVFIIFFTMLAPFFPYDQIPKYLSVELGVHALVPLVSYIMVKDKEMRLPLTFKKDLATFMILPVSYYIFNLFLFYGSGKKAWTYLFLKFDDPFFLNFSGPVTFIVNVFIFLLLLAIFVTTFIFLYRFTEKANAKKAALKKEQVN